MNFERVLINPVDYNSNPRFVAIGDLNNDTWLDFVLTDRALNKISVFLQSSNGTFRRSTTYSTGFHSLPNTITIADLNNDEQLDIVVAYYGSNSIGIFLGMNDGTFVNHTTIFTNSCRPIYIHIAHLDNNTFLDLVMTDYGTDSINIYSGDGNGNFLHWKRYSAGYDSLPVSVISADLNNDHCLDLVIANSGTNNLGIFFGDCYGEFSDQQVLSTGVDSHPNSVVVGNLNRDNLIDIAVTNYGTKNIGVFLNTGNETFTKQTIYMLENTFPSFIVVADINNDQQMDLIVTGIGKNNIVILLGHASGHFSRPILFVTESFSSISSAVDDLNKDGLPDVIYISNDTNSVSISFSKKEGSQSEARYSIDIQPQSVVKDNMIDTSLIDQEVRTRREYGSGLCMSDTSYGTFDGSSSLAVSDFNNDGHLDIAVGTILQTWLIIFLGNSEGTFTYETAYRIGHIYFQLEIANLNRDNFSDIVVAYYDSNGMFVNILLGYGNGSFANSTIHRTGCLERGLMKVADFNKDNRSDVVIVDSSGSVCVLLAYHNGSFINQISNTTGASPESIAIADFNNDTLLDIVVVNYDNNIGILLGYGNGYFDNQISHPTDFSLSSISVGDINSDKILDLIIVNYADNGISVFLGFDNGSFRDPLTYYLGFRPIYVTIGHLNNDDKLDIIVLNSMRYYLHIIFGYGNGSFGNPITLSAGKTPFVAAVADLNNDDRSDIVVANRDDKHISVFIYSQIQLTTKHISSGLDNDSRLQCIAVNDFNNDNILDIAIVNHGTKTIGLLIGNGDGSFNKETVISLDWNANSKSIVIGDFNKDKQIDLAVTNAGTYNIDLILGNGKGGLTRQRNDGYTLDRPPSIIVADDFNHDGQSEIVVAYDNSSNIDILIVYDPGNFTDQMIYSIGSKVVSSAIGDFNQDAILDIVVANSENNNVGIMLGYGNGSFTKQTTYATGTAPNSVVVGHFNNDIYLDFAVIHEKDKNIGILFGYGNGSFTNQTTYSTNSTSNLIVVSDFSNDTFSDIVMAVSEDRSIKILLSYGNGSFAKSRSILKGISPRCLTVGDVNNDRFIDIIAYDYRGIHTVLGYGNGSFRTSIINPINKLNFYPSFAAVGDFNSDDRLDIVFVNFYYNNAIFFLGHANCSFVEHRTYSVGCNPVYVVAADVNNDARLDIIIANSWGDNISVLLGDGNGSFPSLTKYSVGDYPISIMIADLNNDTRMDIVVINSNSTISVLLGTFNLVFKCQMTMITGHGSFPRSIATGDFNNDNHPDIIVANSGTNSIGVFLGNGDGSFSTGMNHTTILSPSLISVGHLNKDTYLDVVIVYSKESIIDIHLGNGYGSFINHTTYSTGFRSKPQSVSVADFDNDSILDIIISNYDASNVVVFLGDGKGNFVDKEKISIGYGSYPFALSVGDYNSDKKLDFAVANHGTDNLQIYLQTC